MKAAMPPARCALAMTCRASVVLPLDSGPNNSIIRPRGKPIPPIARSSDKAPVGMPSMGTPSGSESFMIEPRPNVFSICPSAFSSIFRSGLSAAGLAGRMGLAFVVMVDLLEFPAGSLVDKVILTGIRNSARGNSKNLVVFFQQQRQVRFSLVGGEPESHDDRLHGIDGSPTPRLVRLRFNFKEGPQTSHFVDGNLEFEPFPRKIIRGAALANRTHLPKPEPLQHFGESIGRIALAKADLDLTARLGSRIDDGPLVSDVMPISLSA